MAGPEGTDTLSPMRHAAPGGGGGDITRVQLSRAATPGSPEQVLWAFIRASTNAIGFDPYSKFLDEVLCDPKSFQAALRNAVVEEYATVARNLPFVHVHSYELLKAATEIFLMQNCGVDPGRIQYNDTEESARFGRTVTVNDLAKEFTKYVGDDGRFPYLELVYAQLGKPPIKQNNRNLGVECFGVLQEKLTRPCFLELIWSYWHEEGMLVQSMNVISRRFQNRRSGERDPLANLTIDSLRPLNNLLWGFIQDEQHRLSVVRRAYEYDHHYGITIEGKAIPKIEGADSRSKFLEAFHTLLQLTWLFYKQDDDTTVVADGFPLLNALKEVHLLLGQGGHNQHGDLPWTARHEMMMMQWLLARPEMRDFLAGRPGVAYREPWMDRVDTMKSLQGWSDSTITHFRDLGVFGEQLLLSMRFHNWNDITDANSAANWARYWRAEVQGYLHAYRAVTGVELRNDKQVDATPPSVHLRTRLAAQQGRKR